MLVKLVLVVMWCAGAKAGGKGALVDALAGVGGGDRASLCSPRGARCAAVLVARASCLQRRQLHQLLVLRDSDAISCDHLHNGEELRQARRVRVKFVHPEYWGARSARAGVALRGVGAPSGRLEPTANSSAVHGLLAQFSPWMEEVYNQFPMGPHQISYAHKWSWFSTPLRMFATSIVLPCVSFVLFFIFVIFFTGNGAEEHIPYKSIEYDKYEESQKGAIGDGTLHV